MFIEFIIGTEDRLHCVTFILINFIMFHIFFDFLKHESLMRAKAYGICYIQCPRRQDQQEWVVALELT